MEKGRETVGRKEGKKEGQTVKEGIENKEVKV